MRDKSRFDLDVDEALAEWFAITTNAEAQYIHDLQNENAVQHRELQHQDRIIERQERIFAEVIAENATLTTRLERMRQERDRAQRALRQPSVWGALVALWDVITGRQS